jgi:hypothetical protein
VELIYDMSLEQFLVRPNAANSRLGGCELALCRGSRGVGFFSTLIGMLLSFKRVFRSAWLSAMLFAAAFVFWNYYPHGLPLPKMITTQSASVTAATGDWSAQVKPAQQDTTINRPSGNSQ